MYSDYYIEEYMTFHYYHKIEGPYGISKEFIQKTILSDITLTQKPIYYKYLSTPLQYLKSIPPNIDYIEIDYYCYSNYDISIIGPINIGLNTITNLPTFNNIIYNQWLNNPLKKSIERYKKLTILQTLKVPLIII